MLALPPAPAPARPRLLLFGTAFAIVAVAMAIVGQLGAYLHLREEIAGGLTSQWLPKGASVNGVAANIMLITMGGMCVLAQWAVYAMQRGDRRNAGYALVLTGIFGIAVINAQFFIWTQLGAPFKSQYGTLVYTTTGTFLVALGAAVVMAAVTAFRSLGGRYSPKDTEGLSATALYTYGLTGVFIAVWYVIYVLK
jgi:heme/copper-type cytochrome/quinol oxidase subunit 3